MCRSHSLPKAKHGGMKVHQCKLYLSTDVMARREVPVWASTGKGHQAHGGTEQDATLQCMNRCCTHWLPALGPNPYVGGTLPQPNTSSHHREQLSDRMIHASLCHKPQRFREVPC